jgi:hypothetical protein
VAGAEQSNLNPYLAAGNQGITSLASMLQPGGALTQQFSFAPTTAQLAQTPGYQFELNQGDQAATRAATAAGNGISGNLDTALSQYNQGLAGTTFNNAYNQALTTFQTNRQNTLQPLSTLINAGQNATNQFDTAAQNFGNLTSANTIGGSVYQGNAGLNNATSVAQLLQSKGFSDAAAAIGQGNIWGNLAGGSFGSALGQTIYDNTPDFGSLGNGIAGAVLGAG